MPKRDDDNEANQRLEERLGDRDRSGWLFDLVRESADEFYRGLGAPAENESPFDVSVRISGIAKIFARRPGDAEKITRLAERKYRERSGAPYRARAFYRILVDIFKRRSVEEPYEDGTTPGASGAPPHDGSAARVSPKQLAEFRKHALSRKALSTDPHKLVAFAWNMYANRRPGRMVEDFATIEVATLAAGILRVLDGEEGIDALLDALEEAEAQSAKEPWILYKWNPVDIVQNWIQDPRPADEVVDLPAHKRIAYVYAKCLGYTAGDIASELGPRTLGALADELKRRLDTKVMSSPSWFDAMTRVSATASERTLDADFRPSITVSDWIGTVVRRLQRSARAQVEEGVRRILRHSEFAPWKLVVFLICHCLGAPVAEIARAYGRKPLADLEREMEVRFAFFWFLEPELVRPLFKSLAKSCENKPAPAALTDGQDLPGTLAKWRSEVLRSVLPDFEEPNEELPLFAYRHGLRRREARV